MTDTIIGYLTEWTEADVYFGVFALWALATVVALRYAPVLLDRIHDDVARLTDGLEWDVDRVCGELRRPRWFDDE